MCRGSRSWFDLLGEDSPVQAAINELRNVRRIAVIDEHASMVSMITQSKVAHWLAKQEDVALGPLASTAIGDLQLGFGEVVVAHHREKAIRVFHRMYELDMSAIAIVNDDSAVIGNMCASNSFFAKIQSSNSGL
jgi:CBS-domain-containing membrane protein